MRRHLREAAKDAGDTLPGNDCLGVMIRRWEKDDGGGVSERYRMHYCRAFKIPFEQFGSAPITLAAVTPDADHAAPSQTASTADTPSQHPLMTPPETPAKALVDANNATQKPVSEAGSDDRHQQRRNGLTLAHEVAMTAHQSNGHAQLAERRDIGEASLEHLRSEVVRLSRECLTAEPLPLFFEMRRVREQLYMALDRKIWPRDEVELTSFSAASAA